MIRVYGHKTVHLVTLMELEQTRKELDKALATYPLYKAKKSYDMIPTREQLNEKILNHYKYYEIGAETVGRFLDELKITMNEIMPYYNELFKTVEIMADIEDPFGNVDIIETVDETRAGTSSSRGTSENTGTSESVERATAETSDKEKQTGENGKTVKFSDTPQNNVDDINNYLTNYTEEKENGNSDTERTGNSETTQNASVETAGSGSSTSSGETSETFHRVYTKKGNQGVNTYAHDMNEFRETIVDVMDKIVNDKRLANLFMLVW